MRPLHVIGKVDSVQDMIRLVMMSDDYPEGWEKSAQGSG